MQKSIIYAAMVKNNQGDLLSYTCASTEQGCEEFIIREFGQDTWDDWKSIGCTIVPVEIKEL